VALPPCGRLSACSRRGEVKREAAAFPVPDPTGMPLTGAVRESLPQVPAGTVAVRSSRGGTYVGGYRRGRRATCGLAVIPCDDVLAHWCPASLPDRIPEVSKWRLDSPILLGGEAHQLRGEDKKA